MARKAKGSFGWRLLLVPAGLALLALKIGLALLLGEGSAPRTRLGDEEFAIAPRAARATAPAPDLVEPAPAPAPAPALAPLTWQLCAEQFQSCECAGRMRWGTPSKYQIFEPKNEPWPCDFNTLGDPAPGENKVCECEEAVEVPTGLEWVFCASQFMLCDCPGRIRWGNARRWKLVQPASPNGSLSCSTQLGDPAPGDAGKHCECEVDPTAPFYASVSPAVRENPREPLVSCEILAQAQDRSVWDQKQWQAVRGLCEASDADVHAAGPDSLGVEDLRRMAEAWLDEGCEQNYRRLYKDGWLEEAFVNFIGSSPSGTKWARINEQLIRSVHLFSTRPVVVVHFGMVRPAEWDPSKYPRLVVLHAAPFPTSVFRRFDLNKFRSLLVARVKTGVQLDADQFVAPGVDRLFALARQEGSEDYPLPILPVHFLRNEELPMFPGQNGGFTMSGGQSHVFDRYCKEGKCKVSTRWGHAHPTWTFWSLPFLGTWLRRHLRDETLPESQGKVALRVTHIDVDEDLLNIGTWEEEGYKQWCKYDVMDPSDFERLLSNRPKGHCKPKGPPPIVEDPVFHPEGAAVVFLTAHHAVEPEVSSKLIDQLASKAKAKELPGPVYFKGCFYQDGEELRREHPKVKCLI